MPKVQTIETKDLKTGMITAGKVYSNYGQLIVEANTPLTKQMIAHIGFYGVESVEVLSGQIPKVTASLLESETQELETYSERVRNSEDFQEFKKDYKKKTEFIKSSLNKVISNADAVSPQKLINESIQLFSENATTISIFDYLHNMRQIDDSTYAHSLNVSMIARMFGMWLGYDEETLDLLTLAGLLHDIGKCQIPSAILGKKGKLSEQEYEIVKQHPEIGFFVVSELDTIDNHIKNAILQHHERYDGTGYPFQLKGDDIDDIASIVAIADVYDAMTADRCYRKGLCPFEVIATFQLEGLNKYNPKFILCFLEHIANTYNNNNVLLSNGRVGKIILINKNLTRPVVQLNDHEFIDLNDHPSLYIQAII